MCIEEYIKLFDFNRPYSISEIKEILLDKEISEEQIVIESYNIFVKNAYKNRTLCIDLSFSDINEKYTIKSIHFLAIALCPANINNPYEYNIRK